MLNDLISEIKKCEVCKSFLEKGCRPVVSFHNSSKIIIVGQAPGIKVHESGIPWDDKSGENLRKWLGVTTEEFYDPKIFGIIPMGFCYPGKGKSGDLPPRIECAPLWHNRIFSEIEDIQLTLLVGNYAQAYYLKDKKYKTLTETVKHFKSYLPHFLPLPHPSPRNNIWMKKNQWFSEEVLPDLQNIIRKVII